jgi:mono/diheme cytochrome c family protein
MIRNRRNQDNRISSLLMVIGFLAALLAIAALVGCERGLPSKKPPIHINPDMDNQPKFLPQSENDLFADSAAMRVPVPGTVSQNFLHEDVGYYTGKDEKGRYIEKNPATIDMRLLNRGQERFNIYCSPCHSRVGDGRGIMVNRGYVPPPSFHQDFLRDTADGFLFDVITNGVRNMPSYSHQVPVDDRWAIIAYIRALQRSRTATINDVPEELRGKIKQAGQ